MNKEKVLMPKRYNNYPIVFIDSTPPPLASKVVYGWIRKAQGMGVISLS
ncbi:hypothetical protein [Candidatus Regiella insecticola]|uniref:Mobile element protein n=1 Tax=Candidatus Regiella insecticola TaxID=138073 RepID=A0A6L2ZRI8_9ENTR|nr:hypothetical protein [Candidatus Regiella insecticola]GFN46798.1 mobile element protein [Candidatus Regiella insecticola]